MLGWKQEVQWRGEGPRTEFHSAAAPLRTYAHGAAGDSWKSFILQTQGIAGTFKLSVFQVTEMIQLP